MKGEGVHRYMLTSVLESLFVSALLLMNSSFSAVRVFPSVHEVRTVARCKSRYLQMGE